MLTRTQGCVDENKAVRRVLVVPCPSPISGQWLPQNLLSAGQYGGNLRHHHIAVLVVFTIHASHQLDGRRETVQQTSSMVRMLKNNA